MPMNDSGEEPLRHPRPLTAAELYLECEKEQEAVVCLGPKAEGILVLMKTLG